MEARWYCERNAWRAVMTYQAYEQEEDEERPAQDSVTVHVAVAHGGHGDDQEVHARPVRELGRVGEVQRVSRVLQLQSESSP